MRRPLALALICLMTPVASRAAPPAEIDWGDLFAVATRGEGAARQVVFSPALLPRAGATVSIHGWITPVNFGDGEKITTFLLTGTPGTCPFCLGLGPEGFVLVHTLAPVPADPTVKLHVTGRFSVSADDPSGFFYRLDEARAEAAD